MPQSKGLRHESLINPKNSLVIQTNKMRYYMRKGRRFEFLFLLNLTLFFGSFKVSKMVYFYFLVAKIRQLLRLAK